METEQALHILKSMDYDIQDYPDLKEALDIVQKCLIENKELKAFVEEYTDRHVDLAYLTGVFNVVGIDGLDEEIKRLKAIGMSPHDLFTKGVDFELMNVTSKLPTEVIREIVRQREGGVK